MIYVWLALYSVGLFYAGMRFQRDRTDGLLERWPRDPRDHR